MTHSKNAHGLILRVLLIGALSLARLPGAIVSAQEAKTDRTPQASTPTVAEILEWLPTNTETLLVTRGPYKLQPADDGKAYLSLSEYLERSSYAFLHDLREGKYITKLAGREVTLAVEGARHFQPGGLGLCPYVGCHVLMFREPLGITGEALKKSLATDAKKVEKLAGCEVFTFEEKYEQTQWTLFLALPRPGVLLWGTDRSYVQEVLERMSGKGEGRAFPESLPEWKHVNRNARSWAIRHYHNRRGENPWAMGLVFVFDPTVKPGKEKPAIVKFLSLRNLDRGELEKQWTYVGEREWKPRIQTSGPGVVEIIAELRHEGDAARFFYLLLFHLGHAIGC